MGRLKHAPQAHPAGNLPGRGSLDRKRRRDAADRASAAVGDRDADAVGKGHRQEAGHAALVGHHVVVVVPHQRREDVADRGRQGRLLLAVDGHFEPEVVVVEDPLPGLQLERGDDAGPFHLHQRDRLAGLDRLACALKPRPGSLLAKPAATGPAEDRCGRKLPTAGKGRLGIGEGLDGQVAGQREVVDAVVGLGRLAEHDLQALSVRQAGQ